MSEFKQSDSLGAQPIEDQVKYLMDIGDFADAKDHINDMIRFAPQLDGMKRSISAFISNPNAPYEDRVDVWFRTPNLLCTIESFVPDGDEEVEALFPDWTQRVAYHRHQEVDLRDVFIGDFKECHEDGDEEDKSKFEIVKTEDHEVPKVIVDFCLKRGIHGFINDW